MTERRKLMRSRGLQENTLLRGKGGALGFLAAGLDADNRRATLRGNCACFYGIGWPGNLPCTAAASNRPKWRPGLTLCRAPLFCRAYLEQQLSIVHEQSPVQPRQYAVYIQEFSRSIGHCFSASCFFASLKADVNAGC